MKLSDLPALPRDNDGPVFAEPWEAQAFAMAVKLAEAQVFTWGEWAEAIGDELHRQPDRPYYESWLAALESLVERKRLVTHSERHGRIAAWDRAARATPHGQPIVLATTSGQLIRGAKTHHPSSSSPLAGYGIHTNDSL